MKMRIVIATGIYPPDIGGPATYSYELAVRLAAAGHRVVVVTYAATRDDGADASLPFTLVRVVRGNRVLNRIRYFFAVYPRARESDCLYLLDWFAAGAPAALAAKVAGKPYVVRIGGDYLWEQRYLESGAPPVSLSEFYRRGAHRALAYAPWRAVISFVLRGAAHVVFNSRKQSELYERYLHTPASKSSVVENPVPRPGGVLRGEPTTEFVYWGRFIVMKNLDTLLRAFFAAHLPERYTLALIGDGPQKGKLVSLARELGLEGRVLFEPSMARDAVLERVKNCRAFILPSWTDIAPNQVYESLAIGLPALVTKENYLRIAEELPERFAPESVDELAKKIQLLAADASYETFAEAFRSIRLKRDWNDVVAEHVRLFEGILGRRDGDFRVLQIGADRSPRGVLFEGTPAYERQRAYARKFDALDIIGFSRRSDRAKRLEDGPLRIFPTHSRSRFLYGFDALRIARRLPRPDVVSAQDPFEAGFVAWLIARRLRVPLHVQVHTDFLSPAYGRHSLLNRARVLLAGFVLRRAARVRVVSGRIKDGIAKKYGHGVSVQVLPVYAEVRRADPADTQALRARFGRFKWKLLVVARLEKEKQVELALRAFAYRAPRGSCLIIVGDGRERLRLERLVGELGVGASVFFEGERPAAPYYGVADLVLVPSKYEGYGLVIVEALASGVPVLSTDVGVAREAGAIVSSDEHFADSLKAWFEKGPRAGELKGYPYKSFNEYVSAYAADILSCVARQKSQ